MAYEILKSIVEAEARAVEIKKQAVAQAEERKADALKQQEILLEEAKLQGAKEMGRSPPLAPFARFSCAHLHSVSACLLAD